MLPGEGFSTGPCEVGIAPVLRGKNIACDFRENGSLRSSLEANLTFSGARLKRAPILPPMAGPRTRISPHLALAVFRRDRRESLARMCVFLMDEGRGEMERSIRLRTEDAASFSAGASSPSRCRRSGTEPRRARLGIPEKYDKFR